VCGDDGGDAVCLGHDDGGAQAELSRSGEDSVAAH
jgi:hypothetical protein